MNKKVKIISIILIAVTSMILISVIYIFNNAKSIAKEFICFKQMKSIGLALKHYAMDNDDYYPPYDGAAGLVLLMKNNYLYDSKSFICPCSGLTHAAYGMPLKEENVSYVYQCGLNETRESETIPILWDKYGNHRNFGHVLYCDGHVEMLKGKNWQNKLKTTQTDGK